MRQNARLVQNYLVSHTTIGRSLMVFTEIALAEEYIKNEAPDCHPVLFESPALLAAVMQSISRDTPNVLIDASIKRRGHCFSLAGLIESLIEDGR